MQYQRHCTSCKPVCINQCESWPEMESQCWVCHAERRLYTKQTRGMTITAVGRTHTGLGGWTWLGATMPVAPQRASGIFSLMDILVGR